jgi:hypothetical protein
MFRRLLATSLVGSALAVAMVGPVAAQNTAGDSLVNVQITDVTIAVPVALAANLCDINVNILAQQLDAGDTTCTADAESVASPGTGDGGGGGGNQAGNSLVNVQIAGLDVFLPVAIAANVCDVSVNALATQFRFGEVTCDAVAQSEA